MIRSSSDIVERLREEWDEPFDALAREAADEIERLRAELRALKEAK